MFPTIIFKQNYSILWNRKCTSAFVGTQKIITDPYYWGQNIIHSLSSRRPNVTAQHSTGSCPKQIRRMKVKCVLNKYLPIENKKLNFKYPPKYTYLPTSISQDTGYLVGTWYLPLNIPLDLPDQLFFYELGRLLICVADAQPKYSIEIIN